MTNKRLALVCAGGLCVVLLLALSSGTAQAQGATDTPTPTPNNATRIFMSTIRPPSSCGSTFKPCGSLPWPVPIYPTVALPSPTLYEIYAAPATPDAGTPTWTPSPSPTPVIDTGPISTLAGDAGALAGTLSVQGTQILIMNETPIGLTNMAEDFGNKVGGPFAFVRAVQEAMGGLGLIGAAINFLFIVIAFTIFIRLSTIVAPAIIGLVRLVLHVIQAIGELIPF
jgi:hypothetical protein